MFSRPDAAPLAPTARWDWRAAPRSPVPSSSRGTEQRPPIARHVLFCQELAAPPRRGPARMPSPAPAAPPCSARTCGAARPVKIGPHAGAMRHACASATETRASRASRAGLPRRLLGLRLPGPGEFQYQHRQHQQYQHRREQHAADHHQRQRRCTCDPIPVENAAGNRPTQATMQVIITGRSCVRQVCSMALARSSPDSRLKW